MKYIYIKFNSAKFVTCPVKSNGEINTAGISDDRYFDMRTQSVVKRTMERSEGFHDPYKYITAHQVSGMLHMLLGCRPVSYIRGSLYKSCPYIDEMAKATYVHLDTSHTYVDKSGQVRSHIEINQSQKSAQDSHDKSIYTYAANGEKYGGDITWATLERKYMLRKDKGGEVDKSSYETIMEFFASICDFDTLRCKYQLIDFLHLMGENEDQKQKCIKFFQDHQMTPLIHVINHNVDGPTMAFNFNTTTGNLAARTNTHGIIYKTTLRGMFAVPVSDDDVTNFFDGIRMASFGDGGCAEFVLTSDGYRSEDDSDDELIDRGFVKIETITNI